MSATPILDRQQPLPRPLGPFDGTLPSTIAAALGSALIAAPYVMVLSEHGLRRDSLRLFVPLGYWGGFVGLVVSAVLAFYALVAIHELGHVAFGVATGFRFISIRVGPVIVHRGGRVTLHRGPGMFINGVADLVPEDRANLRWRAALMVAGGPLSNILTAVVIALLPGPVGPFAVCLGAFSLVNACGDLTPTQVRLGTSDGARIRAFLFRPLERERVFALWTITRLFREGISPADVPDDLIDKATAARDGTSESVMGHAFAYSKKFVRAEDDETARLLEIALADSGAAPDVTQVALISDAAVFQGRRRKNAVAAREWLGALPRGAAPWLRARAEAAALQAEGKYQEALRALAPVEAAMRAFPVAAQGAMLLGILETWQQELRSAQI